MSLYDDVDENTTIALKEKQPETTPIANNWNNNSFKLLEAQLQAKKLSSATQSSLKRDHVKISSSIAPVIDLSDKRRKKDGESATNQTTTTTSSTQSLFQTLTQINSAINISNNENKPKNDVQQDDEEYDPLKPNDYEKLVEELKKKKLYSSPNENDSKSKTKSSDKSKDKDNRDRDRYKERDRDREHHSSRHKGREMRPHYDEDDRNDSGNEDKHNSEQKRPVNTTGAAFAPPPSLIEEDRKSINESNDGGMQRGETNLTVKSVFSTGRTLAEKMMEKMGYKEGEGLGRNRQGMSIPLLVEKVGKRGGRVIHEKDLSVKETPKEAAPTELMKNPTKVILLRNMVGPGEVDGDLEGETKEECEKYGEVQKVVIFEIPDTTPDEAVRIFIEFKTLPSAIKALVDLNGRFFGGRIVKATFYNLDKFRQYLLAEDA